MILPDLALWKWLAGFFVGFSIGVAKTGVPGLGILAVPIFILTVGDARLSAGWLLPILLCADVFAVWHYRRHADMGQLVSLLPWVIAGLAGGAFMLFYPDRVLRPVVGAITMVMILLFLRRLSGRAGKPPTGWWYSGFFGLSAGFATMVANAAGPVMNVYLLSKQLPRERFVGTGAWFFLCVNLSKAPVYAAHGLFSASSLTFDICMFPATIAGALTGKRLLHLMPERVFLYSVLVLAIISTALLFFPLH